MFNCCCAAADGQAVDVVEAAPKFGLESAKVTAIAIQTTTTTFLPFDEASKEPPSETPAAAAAAEEDADPRPKTFDCEWRREPNEVLGIKCDFLDERCVQINRLSSDANTPVARYNAGAPEGRRVEEGDYLIAVNGLSLASKLPEGKQLSDVLRDELVGKEAYSVTICRPHCFEIQVEKKSRSLGLDLKYSSTGKSLVITKMSEGAIQSDVPEVEQFDRIVGVNGTEGNAKVLVQAISEAGEKVSLKLNRPSKLPPRAES